MRFSRRRVAPALVLLAVACLAEPVVAAVLPDPRGLWWQGFMGPVVTKSYWYATFIFSFIHYATLFLTHPVSNAPPLMQFDFLVRMLIFVLYGSIAGLFWSAALGAQVLVPVHSFKGEHVNFGPILSTTVLVWAIQAVAHATGATQVHNPFPGSLGVAGDWILFAVYVLLFAVVMVWTWLWPTGFVKLGTMKFSLAFRYRNRSDNFMAVEFLLFTLVLPLFPQIFWDYLVLPPINWSQIAAGTLTLVLEVLVYVGTYFWGRWRRLDTTFFDPENSRVSWGEWILAVGGLQIAFGIAYLIAAEFLDDLAALNIFLGVTTVLVIAGSIGLGHWLRTRPRAKLYRKKHRADLRAARNKRVQ